MSEAMDRITTIIRELGKLPAIGPDDDIYAAGFSSVRALELLLELESAFEVSIPDDSFTEARTPKDFDAMIAQLRDETR